MRELDELLDYWKAKFPHVVVHMLPHQAGQKFRGKIISHNEQCDLCTDTLGELIAQGEAFLRRHG